MVLFTLGDNYMSCILDYTTIAELTVLRMVQRIAPPIIKRYFHLDYKRQIRRGLTRKLGPVAPCFFDFIDVTEGVITGSELLLALTGVTTSPSDGKVISKDSWQAHDLDVLLLNTHGNREHFKMWLTPK